MKFPHKLFKGPIECCHVDAKNPQVLQQHLVCASLEHPISLVHDEKYFGPDLKFTLLALKSKGYVTFNPSAEIWNYIGPEKIPSRGVSIRAIESEKYKVIDMKNYQVLEEIEESKAFFQVIIILNMGNRLYFIYKMFNSSFRSMKVLFICSKGKPI